ncbi:Mu transposase C-terminal domain-containing protein [Streptosporangium sp. NPDC049248]|uniref:Mu transposase C-terminal domain-containing protein n=1 Tax=Streptosporangium sp. NPDC049248 TaxID=3155651 RepID=UPI00342C52EE
MANIDHEQREIVVKRLRQLREAGYLTAEHVRLAASSLGLSERTLWRWLNNQDDVHRTGAKRIGPSLAAGGERRVFENRILFRGFTYLASELHRYHGYKVEVHYIPSDNHFVEVHLGAQHLCTAHMENHPTAGRE